MMRRAQLFGRDKRAGYFSTSGGTSSTCSFFVEKSKAPPMYVSSPDAAAWVNSPASSS